MELDLKVRALIQNYRPQVCYVLSLLRIHKPDCEHCMARERCGDDLRKRLEELDVRILHQPPASENQDRQQLPRAG